MTDYDDLWYHANDGLTLYARDYHAKAGKHAPLLLCMHGLTRNSADFHELALHLSDRFRVIAADQRGRGRSAYDSVVANYTPLTYVQDMFTLLDKLAIKQVTLIGTSMGGIMAMLMAAMQGERIRSVILNDIGPVIDPRGLERIKSYVGKLAPVSTWDDAITQAKLINGIAFPDFTQTQWESFTHGIYHDENGTPVLSYDPAISQPIEQTDEAAAPADLWPAFDALATIPTLLVRGALSDLISTSCVAQMRERKPDLATADIENRGHAPTLVEPQALAAINHFLATNHTT